MATGEGVPEGADLRAKDMYRSLPRRRIVGEELSERVGARGWKAPRFAKGRRLFGRCGLPDPWDPDAPQVDVGLGDVGIASAKRAPAPHAAPPAGPKPPPGFPNIPRAPAASSPSPDAAAGRPAPKIGETRAFKKEDQEKAKHTPTQRPKSRDGTFGAGKVMQPVAKLPMRPGMEPTPTVAASPASFGASSPVVPAPRTTSPPPAAFSAPVPQRPPAPLPTRPPPNVRSQTTSELVELPMPEAEVAAPVVAEKPAAPVVNRSVAPSKGGLDDLFGMGSGDNTRVRMPKKEETPTSRRPLVSTKEEMEKAGIDRRPPSIKPPNVKPSGGGGGFDPGDEGA